MKRMILATLMMMFLTGATAPTVTRQQPENVPSAQPETVECVPGAHDIKVEETEIIVTGGELKAKFITPDPGTGVFNPLPGLILTHGFLGNHTNLEADAANYARGCYAVLAHDYWGQGENLISTPLFSFYGDNERNDITRLVEVLQEHPMVDGLKLGILGHSQAAIQAWLALADADTRGLFVVAIPYDGYPLSTQRLLPQDCVGGNLARFVDPASERPLCTCPNPDECPATCGPIPGATWDDTVHDQLYAAYVTSHPPDIEGTAGLRSLIEARDIENDLGPITGVAFPHLLDIFSWYDSQQLAPESVNAYTLVTPPAHPDGYPAKRLLVNRDQHSNAPWNWNMTGDQAYRNNVIREWLNVYLRGEVPAPPFKAVEVMVDTFDTNGVPFSSCRRPIPGRPPARRSPSGCILAGRLWIPRPR